MKVSEWNIVIWENTCNLLLQFILLKYSIFFSSFLSPLHKRVPSKCVYRSLSPHKLVMNHRIWLLIQRKWRPTGIAMNAKFATRIQNLRTWSCISTHGSIRWVNNSNWKKDHVGQKRQYDIINLFVLSPWENRFKFLIYPFHFHLFFPLSLSLFHSLPCHR